MPDRDENRSENLASIPRSPQLQETAETAYISTTWRPPKQKPCGSEEIGLGRALVLLEFQGSAAPARPNLWKSDRPRWKLGLAAPWSCTNRPAEMGNGPGRSLKSAVREPNPFKASRLVRFSHSSPSVLGFWKVGPAGAALVAIWRPPSWKLGSPELPNQNARSEKIFFTTF